VPASPSLPRSEGVDRKDDQRGGEVSATPCEERGYKVPGHRVSLVGSVPGAGDCDGGVVQVAAQVVSQALRYSLRTAASPLASAVGVAELGGSAP